MVTGPEFLCDNTMQRSGLYLEEMGMQWKFWFGVGGTKVSRMSCYVIGVNFVGVEYSLQGARCNIALEAAGWC